MRTALLRLTAVALGTLAVALSSPARPVAAHGGPLVYSGAAGPYLVEAYRIWNRSGDHQVLTYRLHIRDRATRQPSVGATVAVVLRRDEESAGPVSAELARDDLEVQFEVGSSVGWSVELRIEGSQGEVSLTHPVPDSASTFELATAYGLPLALILVA